MIFPYEDFDWAGPARAWQCWVGRLPVGYGHNDPD